MFGSRRIHCQPMAALQVDGAASAFAAARLDHFSAALLPVWLRRRLAGPRSVHVLPRRTCRGTTPGGAELIAAALRTAGRRPDSPPQIPGRHRQRARAGRVAGRRRARSAMRRCRGCWCRCRCIRRASASAASTRPRRSRAMPGACWRFRSHGTLVRRVRDTPSQTALGCPPATAERARRICDCRCTSTAAAAGQRTTWPSSTT